MTILRRALCAFISLFCQGALTTSFIFCAAFVLSALGFVPVAESEPLPTVAEAIAKVRPVTNQDAAVHTVLVHGHVTLGEAIWGFRYSYEAPSHYIGLQSIGPPAATYLAAVDNRAFSYDPTESTVTAFTDVIPGFRVALVNHSMQILYGFGWRGTDSAEKPAVGVLIDVPSILRDSSVNIREIQPIEESKYRLVGTSLNGDPIMVTVDATRSLVTDLQMGVEEGKLFVQIRVNGSSVADPAVPTTREVQRWIPVREKANPGDLPTLVRMQMLPIAALYPPFRTGIEFGTGAKPDWTVVEANLKRDAANLRNAFPTP